MDKFLKKYFGYLKDNPEGHWFKRKMYGWGWVPVKWQGWVVLLGYVSLFILAEYIFMNLALFGEIKLAHALIFLGFVGTITVILIRICYKTGEAPRWQWGNPEDK